MSFILCNGEEFCQGIFFCRPLLLTQDFFVVTQTPRLGIKFCLVQSSLLESLKKILARHGSRLHPGRSRDLGYKVPPPLRLLPSSSGLLAEPKLIEYLVKPRLRASLRILARCASCQYCQNPETRLHEKGCDLKE